MSDDLQSPHDLGPPGPEDWIVRFAPLVPPGGTVLDLACGSGRHARFFLQRRHPVVALDRTTNGLDDIKGRDNLEIVIADIETGPWPLDGRVFAGIIVVNYLHRPLLPKIAASLAPGGVLIYQTFAHGNERFGKPSNPDFLLRPNELLEAFAGDLEVIAYEAGEVPQPRPAVIQRICAIKRSGDLPYRLPT
jgi:SAM-dependent methyltransferase